MAIWSIVDGLSSVNVGIGGIFVIVILRECIDMRENTETVIPLYIHLDSLPA